MTDTADSPPPCEPPVRGTAAEHLLGALERRRAALRWEADGLDAAGLGATVGAVSDPDGTHASLRRLLLDLLGEDARHTGHTDPLREAVDGLLGEGPPGGLAAVTPPDPKTQLLDYLQQARDAVVWKLDGLGEREVRRPLTPTGTNLLGLVKHLAGVESSYLGSVFDRPFPEALAWTEDGAEPNADMWATPDESRDDVVALYRRVWAHSDATVAALPLDAAGEVPWWRPESRRVTLSRILVHLVAETHRHAGHADVVRELVNGAAGHRAAVSNLPDGDAAWWTAYRARLQDVADRAGG